MDFNLRRIIKKKCVHVEEGEMGWGRCCFGQIMKINGKT